MNYDDKILLLEAKIDSIEKSLFNLDESNMTRTFMNKVAKSKEIKDKYAFQIGSVTTASFLAEIPLNEEILAADYWDDTNNIPKYVVIIQPMSTFPGLVVSKEISKATIMSNPPADTAPFDYMIIAPAK